MDKQTRIQWKICKEPDESLKDIYNPEIIPLAGKVINRSYVTRNCKQFLCYNPRKSQAKPEKIPKTPFIGETTKMQMEGHKDSESRTTKRDEMQKHVRGASLKDLRPEDKKRVAKLIKELAKAGEERELAVEQLQRERLAFQEKMEVIQREQEQLTAERDNLREKILQQLGPKRGLDHKKNVPDDIEKTIHDPRGTISAAEVTAHPPLDQGSGTCGDSSRSTDTSAHPVRTYYYLSNVDQDNFRSKAYSLQHEGIGVEPKPQSDDILPVLELQNQNVKPPSPHLANPSRTDIGYRGLPQDMHSVISQLPPHVQFQFLMQQTKLQEQQLKLQDQIHKLQEMQLHIMHASSQSDISTLKSSKSTGKESSASERKLSLGRDGFTSLPQRHGPGGTGGSKEDVSAHGGSMHTQSPLKIERNSQAVGLFSTEQPAFSESVKWDKEHSPTETTSAEPRLSTQIVVEDSQRAVSYYDRADSVASDTVHAVSSNAHADHSATQSYGHHNQSRGVPSFSETTSVCETAREYSEPFVSQRGHVVSSGGIVSSTQGVRPPLPVAARTFGAQEHHKVPQSGKYAVIREVQHSGFVPYAEGTSNAMMNGSHHVIDEGEKENKSDGLWQPIESAGFKNPKSRKIFDVTLPQKRSNLIGHNHSSSPWRGSDVFPLPDSAGRQPRTSTRLDKLLDVLSDMEQSSLSRSLRRRAAGDHVRRDSSKLIDSRGPGFSDPEEAEESSILQEVFFVSNSSYN